MTFRTFAIAVVAAALVGAGATLGVQALRGGGSEQDAATVKHFADRTLSFDYPATWRRHANEVVSSFSSGIVFLSTDPMHDPCVTTELPEGTRTECGWPVDSLAPNGVLVEWSAWGSLHWTLRAQSGTETSIDGHAAKIVQKSPGDCGSVGAEATLTIYIERNDAPGNWYQMRACLKGPDLDQAQRQISLLLATTRIREP